MARMSDPVFLLRSEEDGKHQATDVKGMSSRKKSSPIKH